jgi:hypothetical protein
VTRALLWLLGGFVLFVLAVLVTAPELLGADDDQLAGFVAVAVAAAVPGLVLLAVAVVKRRRAGDPHPDDDRDQPPSAGGSLGDRNGHDPSGHPRP